MSEEHWNRVYPIRHFGIQNEVFKLSLSLQLDPDLDMIRETRKCTPTFCIYLDSAMLRHEAPISWTSISLEWVQPTEQDDADVIMTYFTNIHAKLVDIRFWPISEYLVSFEWKLVRKRLALLAYCLVSQHIQDASQFPFGQSRCSSCH